MIVATGNINEDYDTIEIVHAMVSRKPKKPGCKEPGGLPVVEAYQAATLALVEAAKAKGGDGVIHIGYDQRISTTRVGCGDGSQSVLEVTAWGTVIQTTRGKTWK